MFIPTKSHTFGELGLLHIGMFTAARRRVWRNKDCNTTWARLLLDITLLSNLLNLLGFGVDWIPRRMWQPTSNTNAIEFEVGCWESTAKDRISTIRIRAERHRRCSV